MQERNLQVNVENGNCCVIHASGELDQNNCGKFESIINSALVECNGKLDLVLEDLTFVDSCGFRALVKAAIQGEKVGCRFNIISMSAHLDHMLTIAGCKHLFDTSITDQETQVCKAPSHIFMEPYYFVVRKDKGACREVRENVCRFAERMGFDVLAMDDIKLAVGEAISNGVRHGATCGENIEVQCQDNSNRLVITLKYLSMQFDPQAVPIPTYATAVDGGMGIYFMKLVMDKVKYEFQDGFTVLTLEKKLA